MTKPILVSVWPSKGHVWGCIKLLEVANIIDYGRILALYWAVRSEDGMSFALYYSVSSSTTTIRFQR